MKRIFLTLLILLCSCEDTPAKNYVSGDAGKDSGVDASTIGDSGTGSDAGENDSGSDSDSDTDTDTDTDVDTDTDSDTDTDIDTDTDTDTDSDTDSDVDTDADADSDSGTTNFIWTDVDTGFLWEGKPQVWLEVEEAETYCENLTLGGFDDWKLPNIDELRTIISGCPDTITSGLCGVTTLCLETTCITSECKGCISLQGPGEENCYCKAGLEGCCRMVWSSSQGADTVDKNWYVNFQSGRVSIHDKETKHDIRCVR